MSDQSFDGLAGSYDANRAAYPPQLLAHFSDACHIPERGGLVLDVGAGTGISTRQLRAVFPPAVTVIGIEPGDDMRRTAVAHSGHLPNLATLNAPAEALPFRRATVDGVFAAQALHWFDRPKFYTEAARVLRPGGALGLIANNRAWRDSPFLDAYETLLETYGSGYSRHYRRFDIAAELAPIRGLLYERRLSASHVQTMPKASFCDWSFTSTKMQACIANAGEERMRGALEALVAHYFAGDTAVHIRYETELCTALRI